MYRQQVSYKETEKQYGLFNQSYSAHITPLVIHALAGHIYIATYILENLPSTVHTSEIIRTSISVSL